MADEEAEVMPTFINMCLHLRLLFLTKGLGIIAGHGIKLRRGHPQADSIVMEVGACEGGFVDLGPGPVAGHWTRHLHPGEINVVKVFVANNNVTVSDDGLGVHSNWLTIKKCCVVYQVFLKMDNSY